MSVNAVVYNGKVHDHMEKLKTVSAELDSAKAVIVIPYVPEHSVQLPETGERHWYANIVGSNESIGIAFFLKLI